jgi:hypothetical protein
VSLTPATERARVGQSWRSRPGRVRPQRPRVSQPRTIALASAGGLAFWVVNFAISLTPIAAEYRSALSIDYVPMLLGALVGGMVIGLCVAYLLQRFFDKIPPTSPVLKALVLSGAALLAVTVVLEAPAKLIATSPPATRHFLIGLLFNGLRILALGLAIGTMYTRPVEDRET